MVSKPDHFVRVLNQDLGYWAHKFATTVVSHLKQKFSWKKFSFLPRRWKKKLGSDNLFEKFVSSQPQSIYSAKKGNNQGKGVRYLQSNWSIRPNPEDRINRKPDHRKNDRRTINTKKQKTKKMISTVLNLIFGPIYI